MYKPTFTHTNSDFYNTQTRTAFASTSMQNEPKATRLPKQWSFRAKKLPPQPPNYYPKLTPGNPPKKNAQRFHLRRAKVRGRKGGGGSSGHVRHDIGIPLTRVSYPIGLAGPEGPKKKPWGVERNVSVTKDLGGALSAPPPPNTRWS